jgi:hypothetical protein
MSVAAIAALLSNASAFAQTPGTAFTYQGKLELAGASASGPFDMRFQLWVSETDPIGPAVCKDNVLVADGLFTAELDFGQSVLIGFPLWLEIEVRADATPGNCGSGSFALLAPRQPLTPAPYAIWATTAQTAGLRLPFNGTSTSGILLHLTNASNAQSTSTGFFENYSTGNNSRAVTAYANGNSGTTYGVYVQSHSTAGYGVYARSFGVAAIHGLADRTTGETYGVYGESGSASGYGVYGLATAPTGNTVGVYGRAESPNGKGVLGSSQDDIGVSGSSATGTGVLGTALSLDEVSYGVAGQCVSLIGSGVYGVALNAGNNYGVFGQAYGNSSYGVWSSGRFGASGTKSFRIDHPLDPENKYLNHYCTEAPEPLNAYSGTACLDGKGQAWVELPDYFAQINRDPRVLLTAAGAPMPNLHVAEEIVANRFKIAGGAPAGKVYWRVEATRSDRWVQTYGAPEQVEKTPHERGRYQNPELYGQPPEAGIHDQPRHELDERWPRQEERNP